MKKRENRNEKEHKNDRQNNPNKVLRTRTTQDWRDQLLYDIVIIVLLMILTNFF